MFDLWDKLSSGEKVGTLVGVLPLMLAGAGSICKTVWQFIRRKPPFKFRYFLLHANQGVAIVLTNLTEKSIKIEAIRTIPDQSEIQSPDWGDVEADDGTMNSAFLPHTIPPLRCFQIEFYRNKLPLLVSARKVYVNELNGTRHYIPRRIVKTIRAAAKDAEKQTSSPVPPDGFMSG